MPRSAYTNGVAFTLIIFDISNKANSIETIDRIKTDIGYFRVLNALGILGFIFLYGFILWIFIETIKNLSDYRNKILVLVLCIFLLITEYKEPFLFKVELNMMILILYISTILLKEKIE